MGNYSKQGDSPAPTPEVCRTPVSTTIGGCVGLGVYMVLECILAYVTLGSIQEGERERGRREREEERQEEERRGRSGIDQQLRI